MIARRVVLLLAVVPLWCLNVGWYARYDPFSPGILDYLGYLGAPLWFFAGGCALLAEWAHTRGRATHVMALVTLVARGPNDLVITQNIDGLHRAAIRVDVQVKSRVW